MQQSNEKKFFIGAKDWIKVIIFSVALGLSLQSVKAWTEPDQAPPNGNVGAPLNTSSNAQTKVGNLTVNALGVSAAGTASLLVPNGNAGFGKYVGIGESYGTGVSLVPTNNYRLYVEADGSSRNNNRGIYVSSKWPGVGDSSVSGVFRLLSSGSSPTTYADTWLAYRSEENVLYGTTSRVRSGSATESRAGLFQNQSDVTETETGNAQAFLGYRSGTTYYGGKFAGNTAGINTSSCVGCSVISEMMPVSEMPKNGDVMCINKENGQTEICRDDKSSRVRGVAQEKAEQILRMGCKKTLEKENGENSLTLGVMNTSGWRDKEECQGWYPIALSGLSEETNVVCHSPNGRKLQYGDILVTSADWGRLRPIDEDEDVKDYQIAGKADTICQEGKDTDSIMVWIN